MADAKKKVLVIEDDVFLSQLLSNRLQKLGVEVLRAADGEEGLKSIKEGQPNLVLLDLILPRMSGFEVLESIRTDPMSQNIPIIIISNLGQDSDISKGKELGAIEYFVKAKTSIDGLVEKVQEVLGGEIKK
jgi:DNA-binding response OmpR family regulator